MPAVVGREPSKTCRIISSPATAPTTMESDKFARSWEDLNAVANAPTKMWVPLTAAQSKSVITLVPSHSVVTSFLAMYNHLLTKTSQVWTKGSGTGRKSRLGIVSCEIIHRIVASTKQTIETIVLEEDITGWRSAARAGYQH